MISDETACIAEALYGSAGGGPVATKLLKAIRERDWVTIASCKVDPRTYDDAEEFWRDYTLSSFLRKNEDLPPATDLESEAVQKFIQAEQQCLKTNRRLYALRHGFNQEPVDERAREILFRARKIIRGIVGHRPRADSRTIINEDISGEIPRFCAEAAHGPGATLSDPSKLATVPDKFESVPTMTVGAMPFLVDWMSTMWAEVHTRKCSLDPTRSVKIVRSGKFFTVHKDALSLRGCEKQPNINVWYQLATGRELRRLFKPYVDLQTAKEKHARLAQQGSAGTAPLCTKDLKQASDTVCTELVTLCWPKGWVEVFNALRTSTAELPDGRVFRLEKISSMGNGFTFELESITFYALCLAAAGFDESVLQNPSKRSGFSVLGDDIICPTEYSREVDAVLQYCGFLLNMEKSFDTGPFRESCGADFFGGVPVRPYFLKKSVEQPCDLIGVLNGLRRSAHAGGDKEARWAVVKKAWHLALSYLPRSMRDLYGPEALGDLVIHAPTEKWRSKTVNSIRYFRAYQPAEFTQFDLEKHWGPDIVMASKLYGVSCQDPKGSGVTWIRPRGDPLAYRISWVPCS